MDSVKSAAGRFGDMYWQNNKLLIEAVATDTVAARLAFTQLGIEDMKVVKRVLSGYVTMPQLLALKQTMSLRWVRVPLKIQGGGGLGSATTTAETSDGISNLRQVCNMTGDGIKVGIISDSYNKLSGANAGIASGDLPGVGNPNVYTQAVQVLSEPSGTGWSDEGRALAEIIHDIAPKATLYFTTAAGGTNTYVNNINALVTAGVDVIVSDAYYLSEPFFMDGSISQAFETAIQNGVAVVQHAGNFQENSYDSDYRSSGTTVGSTSGTAHDFDSGAGTDTRQSITINANASVYISLQWDDPWMSLTGTGTTSNYNIYLLNLT